MAAKKQRAEEATKLRAKSATKHHAGQANLPQPAISDSGRPDSPLPSSRPTQGASRWQLVVSALLVGLWIIFLGWMAFSG